MIGVESMGITKTNIGVDPFNLGADKIADIINGGKKKVRVSNENKEILQALYNAGVIFKPERAADGQNYKKINTNPIIKTK